MFYSYVHLGFGMKYVLWFFSYLCRILNQLETYKSLPKIACQAYVSALISRCLIVPVIIF